MILAFLMLLLGASQREIFTRCDMVERNTHYDADTGRRQYEQVIFYEWSPDYRRYDVIAWRLVEHDVSVTVRPGLCTVRWYDRDCKVSRIIQAPIYRESETSGKDPERRNARLREEKTRKALPRKVEYEIR